MFSSPLSIQFSNPDLSLSFYSIAYLLHDALTTHNIKTVTQECKEGEQQVHLQLHHKSKYGCFVCIHFISDKGNDVSM